MLEERQRKDETETKNRSSDNTAGSATEDAAEAGDEQDRTEDNESENALKVTIPVLEKFSGYCHPMPLYVFVEVR